MVSMPRATAARVGAAVAGCTLVLTACFVGVLALATGRVRGIGGRLPVYVLAMAVAFVAALLLIEHRPGGQTAVANGREVLVTAGVVATVTFVVALLAGEGLIYAAVNPRDVFDSQLLAYLLAAALIGSGVGFWALRHWREFA